MPQAGLKQIADGDRRNLWPLLAAGLEADKIWFADVDFGGVFDDQQTVIIGNEVGQDVQQGGLACPGAPADEDVLAIQNGRLEVGGHLFCYCPDANQIMDGKVPRIEFTDGQGNALDAARWQDGGNAAAVRQA